MTSEGPQAAFVASTDSSRWTPTAPPSPLDVERLALAIDAVEDAGVRGGVFDRLTTIDNHRLARSIAAEYEHGYTCGLCRWGRDRVRSCGEYEDHMGAVHLGEPQPR